ncbi:hypothetical protein GNZ12_11585 [Paraburkholderia sp. 1N]|uniref:Guanylate cyclase domain-containing protein n=1 Tax=Paraburkholderia solitsugae TaxID=2675748 RepID=A0ABX2BQ30_9BURK|nr:hypothetical protein [Paraburkholderia solitsugae]
MLPDISDAVERLRNSIGCCFGDRQQDGASVRHRSIAFTDLTGVHRWPLMNEQPVLG